MLFLKCRNVNKTKNKLTFVLRFSGRTLNGQPLLEFPMSRGEPALGPLRIKRAILWARVELRHMHHYQHHRQNFGQKNITLWVFRVQCGNTTHLRGKVTIFNFDQVYNICFSKSISDNFLKLNLVINKLILTFVYNCFHLFFQELGKHLEMVTSLAMNIGQLGWQKFDVTKVVSSWYQSSSKTRLILLVDCTGCGSHVHVSTFGGHAHHLIDSSLNTKGN